MERHPSGGRSIKCIKWQFFKNPAKSCFCNFFWRTLNFCKRVVGNFFQVVSQKISASTFNEVIFFSVLLLRIAYFCQFAVLFLKKLLFEWHRGTYQLFLIPLFRPLLNWPWACTFNRVAVQQLYFVQPWANTRFKGLMAKKLKRQGDHFTQAYS